MPRQLRRLPPLATLHIISRGNRRQNIFEEFPDYARFSASVTEETAAGGIILFAYCLMPNHFHLLLQAAVGALSGVMHRILTSHAIFMNKKYGRTGHLYGDRFYSKICDPEFGIKPRMRYIHRNPVKDGLVARLEDWRWSSHHDYLDPASPNPSGKSEILKLFGKSPAQAIENYAEFMKPDPELVRARAGERFPLEKNRRDGRKGTRPCTWPAETTFQTKRRDRRQNDVREAGFGCRPFRQIGCSLSLCRRGVDLSPKTGAASAGVTKGDCPLTSV